VQNIHEQYQQKVEKVLEVKSLEAMSSSEAKYKQEVFFF
jgi:hypothetical protein